MKILIVGGGTGGHVMPAIAVAEELKKNNPRTKIVFFTDKKNVENVQKIAGEKGIKLEIKKTVSGKFVRYVGWGIKECVKHPWITLKDLVIGNIVGSVRFLFGFLQSFFRLVDKENRPNVIFLKGGYVGLPVGLVAGILKIPYVIHESDATMGLANRLLVKNAKVVAAGMDYLKVSEAIKGKVRVVGIPISDKYREVSEKRQRELKEELGFDPERKLVIVTGGSQGAKTLNDAVKANMPEILEKMNVGLITGKKLYSEMSELKEYQGERFRMWDFSFALNEILGAADIVVSRAGATTIAELAALGKCAVLVPFSKLPGSHQVKNAEVLGETGAAVVLDNDTIWNKPEKLMKTLDGLVSDPEKCYEMGEKLKTYARRGAAKELMKIILEVGGYETGR